MIEALIGAILGGISIWFCFMLMLVLAAFLFGTVTGQIISGIAAVLLFLYGISKYPRTTLTITALGIVLLIIYLDAVDVVLGGIVFLVGAVLLFGGVLLVAGLLLAIKDILFKKQGASQTTQTDQNDHSEEVLPAGEKKVPLFQRSWRTPFSDREKVIIHTGFILYVLICAIAAWLQLESPDWVHAVLIICITVIWYAVVMTVIRCIRWFQRRYFILPCRPDT